MRNAFSLSSLMQILCIFLCNLFLIDWHAYNNMREQRTQHTTWNARTLRRQA